MFQVTSEWLMPVNIAVAAVFILFFCMGWNKGLLRQIVTLISQIDTNAYLDGRDVTDQVVKHLNARTRATGVCELIV